MSATQSPPVERPVQTQPRGKRALEVFDRLLYNNPEVCSSCFAKIRDQTEHDTDSLGTGNRPTETLERAGVGVVGYDTRDLDAYGERRATFTRTYCGECGSPGGTDDPMHIRSLQQIRGDVDQICRRLHEHGYYPDIGTLYTAVESLKTDPDKQGKDREILAAAVYLSIKRGRQRTGPGGLERADAMPPIRRRVPLPKEDVSDR